MNFKTASIKLTLFYVTIVMVISICFSLAIYRLATTELNNGFRRQADSFQRIPNNFRENILFPDFDSLREAQLQESNTKLQMDLIYYNIFILLLSGLVGYWLARKTLQPIEEMMMSQSRFTADASHELRTPLTAMKTEIEVALRSKDLKKEDVQNLLKSNLEEISELELLTSSLLNMAKSENEQNTQFEAVSLEEVVVEAYSKLEKIAMSKEIEFANDLKEVKVQGNYGSLVELVVILLDNAIKYSAKKSKIHIKISHTKNNGIISIKDSGVGIKSSDLPFIFNRFYRSDPSRSKLKVAGYGIGLSIAQNIVKNHHGTIKVESESGKGSTFVVSIPIVASKHFFSMNV